MRIIAGSARGLRLATPAAGSRDIRPTSDRAREALFNILGTHPRQARVLDLFAGTGALGLEAFSREADLVVFVDNHPQALQLIKKNVLRCLRGYQGRGEIRVVQHDLKMGLALASLPAALRQNYTLIFADPPYSEDISLAIVNTIGDSGLLADQGLLVVEVRHSVQLPYHPLGLNLLDRRVYGEAAFWLYRPDPSGALPA